MENPPQSPPPPVTEPPSDGKRSTVTTFIVGAVGLLSAVYLLNPTAGFIELIPDNIPGIGNLDEAAAAAFLISALAYFGIDMGRLFSKAREGDKRARATRKSKTTIDADFVER